MDCLLYTSTAPTGYKLNTEVYKVDVAAGKTLSVTATDERVTGKVKIAKIDKETLAFKAQGDSVLRGAVYGLYAKEEDVYKRQGGYRTFFRTGQYAGT